jgi:hypothetical protein
VLTIRSPVAFLLAERNEKHVVGPLVRGFVVYPSPIPESISVLVMPRLIFVLEADGVHAQFRERVQLLGLRNSIMVLVNPQAQQLPHGIPRVNHAVVVVVVDRECGKAVRRSRRRLWCEVSEQLLATIRQVPAKRERRFVLCWRSTPSESDGRFR